VKGGRRTRGWRTVGQDPAKVGPLLREAGFRGSEADPVDVRASYDADGRPRRIHARYADGWSCVMHLAADRSYSLSQTYRTRAIVRGAGV